MKVLMLNGSAKPNGNTFAALTEIGKTLQANGIEYEIFHIGGKPVRDCLGCGKCKELGRCIFNDDGVNEFVAKAKEADGFVFGTPTYFAHPSGRILSFLDRAFYSSSDANFTRPAFDFKPAAAVAVARRAGTTCSMDVLNKYFGISKMPIVASTYWNSAYGRMPNDVLQDAEGLQTMHNIGSMMAWMLKSFACGKENGVAMPTIEAGTFTHFIR